MVGLFKPVGLLSYLARVTRITCNETFLGRAVETDRCLFSLLGIVSAQMCGPITRVK
jgi:hypothetical protein